MPNFLPSRKSGSDPILEVRRQLYVTYESGSLTYEVGQVVESRSTGYAKHAVKLAPVLGVIIGFENANGALIRPDACAKGSANAGSIETVTVANGEVVIAVINASKSARWRAPVSGTIGTTNDSELPSVRIDIDSDNTEYGRLLETTAVRTAAAKSNFVSHQVDTEVSTNLIVSILNSELDSVNA